jgi:hypothetical protein
MEVSDKFHSPTTFTPRKETQDPLNKKLDVLKKRKISCPYQDANPRPSRL